MFAQRGGRLHVVVVERHDRVDGVGAGQIADGVEDIWPATQVGHQEHLVDALARPGFGSGPLASQQQHARTKGFGGG